MLCLSSLSSAWRPLNEVFTQPAVAYGAPPQNHASSLRCFLSNFATTSSSTAPQPAQAAATAATPRCSAARAMAPGIQERKKTSLAERGTKLLAIQLRLLSVLQCLAGAGYITVAIFLQFPPGDPLTL